MRQTLRSRGQAMTRLSINLNKIAWLRNARGDDCRPDLIETADIAIAAGAQGITVHPRPDLRHITPDDVYNLADWLKTQSPEIEFNLEGNPGSPANNKGYPGFLTLVEQVRPHQCTLVPDSNDQLTSDHGFSRKQIKEELAPVLARLQDLSIRSSVFVDPVPDAMALVAEAGADRIELYTAPYVIAFQRAQAEDAQAAKLETLWSDYLKSAQSAQRAGLGVNAGHDLDLDNLAYFLTIPDILEVSIGHALIADALIYGLSETILKYLQITSSK